MKHLTNLTLSWFFFFFLDRQKRPEEAVPTIMETQTERQDSVTEPGLEPAGGVQGRQDRPG